MNHATFDPGLTLPLTEAFDVLSLLSDQHFILGEDRWRHATTSDSLASIDPSLAAGVAKQPPTKFGHSGSPSLWTATHFYLCLPALTYTLTMYGQKDPSTRDRMLSPDQLRTYFPPFPYLLDHYRELKTLEPILGTISLAAWTKFLQHAWTAANPRLSAGELLSRLPEFLRERASLVLSHQGDSLTGRIALAYLLGQQTAAANLPFDARTSHYLAPMHLSAPASSLFERLIRAQLELTTLGPLLDQYDEAKGLSLGTLTRLISWYGRPHLVEMILPDLTGAAEPLYHSLSALFADLVASGAPDYTGPRPHDLPADKFRATQSLLTIGRLSIAKDIFSSPKSVSDGERIRQLIGHLYTDSERSASWGNPNLYIPDARRENFETFRQDMANIIYCAGLFSQTDNMAGTVDPTALKQLAMRVSKTRSMRALRARVQSGGPALDRLAIDWEARYPRHSRVRLLRFVRATFGLDTITPIPIPFQDISNGFAGTHFNRGRYYLRYQEAGQVLEMVVPIKSPYRGAKTVAYRTLPHHAPPKRTADGLPYSAWLEVRTHGRRVEVPVPGRGSVDPFGRPSHPHAGEVIGFGCSVHHASLAVLLSELASLGAASVDLDRVTTAFMGINAAVHERKDLADFQLAQVEAAFADGSSLALAEYLSVRPPAWLDTSRPHLIRYARTGHWSLDWAEPQAARLAFGFPELYDRQTGAHTDARASWYDGRSVLLPKALVRWRRLTG